MNVNLAQSVGAWGDAQGDQLHGDAGLDRLDGDDGNDRLYGGNNNDTLNGGADDDTLDGGSEADRMTGGAGNDIYYIDDLNNSVFEDSAFGSGDHDTAYVSVRYYDGRKLANIENVVLVGEGSVDRPPPAPSGSADVNEGTSPGTAVLILPRTDAEGQVITYTFDGGRDTSAYPHWFAIVGNEIRVNTNPASPINVGADTLQTYTIHATDGTYTGISGIISLNIRDTPAGNAPPPVPNASAEVLETRQANHAVLQLTQKDADQEAIVYSFEGGGRTSGDGLFTIVGNEIQVVGNAALQVGQDTFKTYRVVADDQHGNTRTGIVAITIKNVNQPPVIDSIAASSQGSPGEGDDSGYIVILETAGPGELATVQARDPDSTNALIYSLDTASQSFFEISPQGKIVTRGLLAPRDYTVTVTVADSQGGEVTQVVRIRSKDVDLPRAHRPSTIIRQARHCRRTKTHPSSCTPRMTIPP